MTEFFPAKQQARKYDDNMTHNLHISEDFHFGEMDEKKLKNVGLKIE